MMMMMMMMMMINNKKTGTRHVKFSMDVDHKYT